MRRCTYRWVWGDLMMGEATYLQVGGGYIMMDEMEYLEMVGAT